MGHSSIHPDSVGPDALGLAVLRHELANALNGLSGMAGLLRSTGLGPDQERWLDAIEQSARQMHFLVHSATCCRGGSLVSGATGRHKFNGMSLVEQTITAHTPAAASKGLKLLLVVAPELPVYWQGHEGLLRQLLDNLLGNALKFTDAGQVLLEICPGEKQTLHLLVQDSGTGVPTADRQRIFGVRERGINGTGRPGSGLGLSVCRQIVDLLGGRISCVEAEGGGAEFRVSLPHMMTGAGQRRRPSLALSSVSCVLHLDEPLAALTTNFLERLGVNCCNGGVETAPASGLLVSISQPEHKETGGWPGLELRPTGYAKNTGRVLLRPPILESLLEQALLRLALAWRWQMLSPGDIEG